MVRWLTAIDDERMTLKFEFYKGMAFVHSSFKETLAGMRAAREIYPQVKAWLKRMGHDWVYVIIPRGDEKRYRCVRSFGFSEVEPTVAPRELSRGLISKNQILLGQEC